MKRLMIALAIVVLTTATAHAETNVEAYNRGKGDGFLLGEQVAAQCRMATLDATYPLEDPIKNACRKIQELFVEVQKEDQAFQDSLLKGIIDNDRKLHPK